MSERGTAAGDQARWGATYPQARPDWLTELQWRVGYLRCVEGLSFGQIARRVGKGHDGDVRHIWLAAERKLYADARLRHDGAAG